MFSIMAIKVEHDIIDYISLDNPIVLGDGGNSNSDFLTKRDLALYRIRSVLSEQLLARIYRKHNEHLTTVVDVNILNPMANEPIELSSEKIIDDERSNSTIGKSFMCFNVNG